MADRDYHNTEALSRDDAAQAVGLAFRSVIARVVLHNYEVAEAVGLSPRDMQAIHLLQLRGPMSPGQLGRALGLASASTTALIDRLENAGYAGREPDPVDRRKLIVTLDEARLAQELAPRYADQAEALRRVVAEFGVSDLDVIRRFLEALSGSE